MKFLITESQLSTKFQGIIDDSLNILRDFCDELEYPTDEGFLMCESLVGIKFIKVNKIVKSTKGFTVFLDYHLDYTPSKENINDIVDYVQWELQIEVDKTFGRNVFSLFFNGTI